MIGRRTVLLLAIIMTRALCVRSDSRWNVEKESNQKDQRRLRMPEPSLCSLVPPSKALVSSD